MDETETAAPPPRGLAAALSSLAGNAVGLLHTRLELLGVEFAEGRVRVLRLLVLVVVAALFLCFAVIALSVVVVVSLWDEHRMGALIGLAVFYAAVGVIALLAFKREARDAAHPFSATLSELERDAEMLRTRR